jgi:hypothetical protein
MEIEQIGHKKASAFIQKWHYSCKCPTGKNIFFGWFSGCDIFTRELYAVADYGIGVNPYQAQSLSKLSGYNVTNETLLELKRLCRIEPKNIEIQLTQFIAGCHKILKSNGFRFIVSFSDPAYNHNGGIYKAANFIHLGKTNPENHAIEQDGTVRHRRYYFRYARRKGITVAQARKELGLKLIKTLPKDRWFLPLNRKKHNKLSM